MIYPEKEKIRTKILKELDEYKVKMKIEQSQKMNKLRLEKLKVKIECVNSVFEEAKTALSQRIKGKPNDYKAVLKNLVVQCLIKLLEENVIIVCKKEDVAVVESVLEDAKAEFKELLHKESAKYKNFDTKIEINSKYFLPETL